MVKIIKIKNDKIYKIGDTVWWFDVYGTLRHGTVIETGTEQNGKLDPVEYVRVHESTGGTMGTERDNAWPTKEDCLDAERRRSEAQIREYEESIGSVEDLVRILFENLSYDPDKDYDLEKAAIARARDLLGINLAENK